MAGETEDRDDIGADLRAAMAGELAQASAPDTPADLAADTPVIEVPPETAQQKADRERDEQGRFAKPGEGKPRDTLTLKPKEEPAKPVLEEARTPDGKPVLKTGNDGKIAPVLAAPADWMGDAKVRWGRLDRSIQEEILRREEARTAAVAEVAPLKELIDANREFLVNQAGSVVEAQRQMMQFARMSVDNPVQLAEHILRARGLDPRAVFSGQPDQAPAQNQPQDTQTLLAQLVQRELQPIRAQFEQRQSRQLQSQIDAFASDPKYPYFNNVRAQMGKLMESGFASTMEEAYEKATLLDPAIRASLTVAQTEEADRKKAAEVERARNAQRASITGSPVAGASSFNGASNPNASIRDDLLAAMKQHAGQV